MRRQAVRTLLYEAANVMLTRYKGQLKLKDWAFAIAKRSTMRKAQGRSGSPPSDHHARDDARRDGVHIGIGSATNQTGGRIQLPRGATP